MNKFYPGIRRLYSQQYSEKLIVPTEIEYFQIILHLGSRDSVRSLKNPVTET